MKNVNNAPLVIFGLGEDKKPRAARFDPAQGEAVRKAAALMGLRVGVPKTPEASELTNKLAVGQLYASGRGLTPLVKPDLYAKLIEKLDLEPVTVASPPKGTNAAPATPAKAAEAPQTALGGAWAVLKVGDKVIAPERRPQEDGWWPGVITAINKDRITLRFLDAPKQPPVTLKRQAVALLYPG